MDENSKFFLYPFKTVFLKQTSFFLPPGSLLLPKVRFSNTGISADHPFSSGIKPGFSDP